MRTDIAELRRLDMAGVAPQTINDPAARLAWGQAFEAIDRLAHARQLAPADLVLGERYRAALRDLLRKRAEEAARAIAALPSRSGSWFSLK